jgi:hypothetical protein
MCVDIRLEINPDLKIVHANAAYDDNDHRAKVAEHQDRSEVHNGAESSVTRDMPDEDCGECNEMLDTTVGLDLYLYLLESCQ